MNMLQISHRELERWRKEGRDFQLIDVREPDEHKLGNLGGDLIPLSELGRHLYSIETTKPVVFYCRKGIRSQLAIQRLLKKIPEGQFYNLTTGIEGQ